MSIRPENSLASLIDLSDKAAIVTGGASGIGEGIAWRLAEAGAVVHLADINEEDLKSTSAEMTAAGYRVKTHVLDVSSKVAVDAFWDGLAEPVPDILVNNAGIYPMEDFLEVTEREYKRVMDVNTSSVFWMCQNHIRRRGKKGGAIINIGSIESMIPFQRDLVPYGMSKAAIVSLTRSLAKEHAADGFRVNAILPGGVRTEGAAKSSKKLFGIDFKMLKAGFDFLQRLPAKRIADPDDIARMVLVMASDLSVYVHGAVIPVDGGFTSA